MARVSAGVVTLGLVIVSLGFPGDATAQSERFFRALMGLHSALDGRLGDEGQEVARRLDEVSAGLAEWDRSIREAELTLRPQLARASPDDAAGIHTALGSLYLQRSRFADALNEFEAASRIAPQRATLHLLRALALDALGRTDDAGVAFRQASTLEPDDPAKAYLALTRSEIEGPDVARITETLVGAYQSVTRGVGQRPSAPFFHLAERADEAGSAPVFPLALYAEGFALHAQGQHEEGIVRLREAAARDPLLTDPASQTERMKQAADALRQGNLATALTALEMIVEASPASSEAHRVLATALGLAGRLEKSVEHLEAALRLRPDDERSWIALARTREDSGALLEAVSTLEAAIEAVPNSGELQWRLAGLSVRLDRNADALEQYDHAAWLTAISGQGNLHQWVATLASLHRDVARASDAVARRVRLNLNDAAAHRDLASLYTKAGRQDEALAELAIAAWLDPDDPLTFVALGHGHMARRSDADAVEALQRAVTLQPDLQEARYALAQALTRVGRREEGRQHLSAFQRLRSESMDKERRDLEVSTVRSEAVAQSLEGQHRLAAQTWMKVITLQPDVAQNYLDLAEALVKAGELEESIPYFVKVAELDGVAEVHLRLADVLARLGRARESALARETYERLQLEDFQRRTRR